MALNQAQMSRVDEILRATYIEVLLEDNTIANARKQYALECLLELLEGRADCLRPGNNQLGDCYETLHSFYKDIYWAALMHGEDKLGLVSMADASYVVADLILYIRKKIETALSAVIGAQESQQAEIEEVNQYCADTIHQAQQYAQQSERSLAHHKNAIALAYQMKLYLVDPMTAVFPSTVLVVNRPANSTTYKLQMVFIQDGDYGLDKHPAKGIVYNYQRIWDDFKEANQRQSLPTHSVEFTRITLPPRDAAITKLSAPDLARLAAADLIFFYSHGDECARHLKKVAAFLESQSAIGHCQFYAVLLQQRTGLAQHIPHQRLAKQGDHVGVPQQANVLRIQNDNYANFEAVFYDVNVMQMILNAERLYLNSQSYNLLQLLGARQKNIGSLLSPLPEVDAGTKTLVGKSVVAGVTTAPVQTDKKSTCVIQ